LVPNPTVLLLDCMVEFEDVPGRWPLMFFTPPSPSCSIAGCTEQGTLGCSLLLQPSKLFTLHRWPSQRQRLKGKSRLSRNVEQKPMLHPQCRNKCSLLTRIFLHRNNRWGRQCQLHVLKHPNSIFTSSLGGRRASLSLSGG